MKPTKEMIKTFILASSTAAGGTEDCVSAGLTAAIAAILTPDDEDRMTRIDDLIRELQHVSSRFGNTCVYIRRGGLSWGAVALNRRDDDQRNGVFDLQAQHDREVALLCERIENLKAERRTETAAPAPQSNVMSPHAFEPTSGDGCAVCGRGPNYTAHKPVGAQHVPCPCTLIEQDDDCPVGYPSMICGICEGTGDTTPEKVTALACEMIKIASDMGEPEDPFAAWESVDLIKSQHGQLRKALAVADQFITNGIELGYIRMPDPDSNDSALLTPGIVRAALASTEAP